jgi:hypothetical protein
VDPVPDPPLLRKSAQGVEPGALDLSPRTLTTRPQRQSASAFIKPNIPFSTENTCFICREGDHVSNPCKRNGDSAISCMLIVAIRNGTHEDKIVNSILASVPRIHFSD